MRPAPGAFRFFSRSPLGTCRSTRTLNPRLTVHFSPILGVSGPIVALVADGWPLEVLERGRGLGC